MDLLRAMMIGLAFLFAGQHSQMPAGMSHQEHLKQLHKDDALAKRGADAMGFDQDAATHHFTLAPDGGTIEVTVRHAADRATLAAIRGHLRSIAQAFVEGRFDKPSQTHGEVPAGVVEMQARKDRIAYTYEDVRLGGAVRIKTTDARALEAVHSFLRYQITEHHTGDPLKPGRI